MRLGRKAEDDLIPSSPFPFCTSFFVLRTCSKGSTQPLFVGVSQAGRLTPPETAPLPQVGADGTRGWVWGWQEGAVLGLASFLLSASMNLGFQLELLKDLGSALFPFLSTASLHRVRLFKKLW